MYYCWYALLPLTKSRACSSPYVGLSQESNAIIPSVTPGSRCGSLFICSKVYSIASRGCTPSSSCNKQVPHTLTLCPYVWCSRIQLWAINGKFYCLGLKFVFYFLVPFCIVGVYTHCCYFHANYLFLFFVFLSFGYLHVWQEPNYILFDSADGKYKLVLDIKTSWVSVMRKSPIKVSQGKKSSEWPNC